MNALATNQELLNRALQATGDPERFAQTLLSALVKSGMAGPEMQDFAPFVRADEKPKLRLVGTEAARAVGACA